MPDGHDMGLRQHMGLGRCPEGAPRHRRSTYPVASTDVSLARHRTHEGEGAALLAGHDAPSVHLGPPVRPSSPPGSVMGRASCASGNMPGGGGPPSTSRSCRAVPWERPSSAPSSSSSFRIRQFSNQAIHLRRYLSLLYRRRSARAWRSENRSDGARDDERAKKKKKKLGTGRGRERDRSTWHVRVLVLVRTPTTPPPPRREGLSARREAPIARVGAGPNIDPRSSYSPARMPTCFTYLFYDLSSLATGLGRSLMKQLSRSQARTGDARRYDG
ncbi:hypothetical protein GGR56DRAFT_623437 [Xylariaceae sp. FL0804]|nr:hypothetical protein GGR56DRAFT_623437 [Xylariaceae sp. FL0804]